jgi:two-component system chemotaxis response regulator CheB
MADRYSKIADEAEHAVSVLGERLSAVTRQSEGRGG